MKSKITLRKSTQNNPLKSKGKTIPVGVQKRQAKPNIEIEVKKPVSSAPIDLEIQVSAIPVTTYSPNLTEQTAPSTSTKYPPEITTKPEATPTSAIIVHRVKTRVQPLDSEIKIAKERALDMNNIQSVWDQLVKMADSKEGCFLSKGDNDELKYGSITDFKFFTKRMLGDRMRRSKKKIITNR